MNLQLNKEEFLKYGYTSFPLVEFFPDQIRIKDEISTHTFKEVPGIHGIAEQCYMEADLCLTLAPFTKKYLCYVQEYLKDEFRDYLTSEFTFNEFKIHKYPVCYMGLDKHRDRQRFEEVILILVMEDGGDFCIYDAEKNPESEKVVPSGRGYCIIMKGYNFNNEGDTRINHAVLRISRPRITIGARYNKKIANALL